MALSALNDRSRFVWIISALLIGGFLATSLISYRVAHDSVSAQIADNTLPLTSDNVYSEIQRDLLRPIFISSLMAQDTFLRDWALDGEQDPEAIIRYLTEIQERYGTVTSFFVSEQSRRYYHPLGVLKTVLEDKPEDTWYFRTRRLPGNEHYEVNIDTDTADQTTTNVFVNYQVLDYSGNLIGVTGVGLAVDVVSRLMEAYQQRYGRRIYFIDRQGAVTLHGSAFEGAKSIRDRKGIDKIATRVLTSPSGSFEYTHGGKKVYLNSRLLPEFKWFLMVEQEEDPAERRLLHTLFVNLALSILVTGVVLVIANLTIGRYQRRLEAMAATDKLTSATSRQLFETLFEHTLAVSKRSRTPISVILLDVDHFKRVNDTYGHLFGDKMLKSVADTVRANVRESDNLCRWGGEEFVVLLPDCDIQSAGDLAERIRGDLANRTVDSGGTLVSVSASFGVAQYRSEESTLELIGRADKALYRAKGLGRNRVVSDRA